MEPRISIITLGVRDLANSHRFYGAGLGFSTKSSPDGGIIFYKTTGTCLALYPIDKLAADVGPQYQAKPGFGGITLAHNVREQHQVQEVLERAEKAGGKIVKPAQDVFWGGHSGYFEDPDGYLWEVAFGAFEFNDDGSLMIP